MGNKTKKLHRKKRISKHILLAEEKRRQEQASVTHAALNSNGTNTTSTEGAQFSQPSFNLTSSQPGSRHNRSATKKKPAEKSISLKDPAEAHAYLSTWQHRTSGSGVWKFNKNTQSWLLRHMYDASKVSKETFSILIRYIQESPSEGLLQKRVIEDAHRRAIRYKNWDEERQKNTVTDIIASSSPENHSQEGKSTVGKVDIGSQKTGQGTEGSSSNNDDKRWSEMNEHHKRKEYKRSRKLLDALK